MKCGLASVVARAHLFCSICWGVAEMRTRNFGGSGCEINNDFSVFIGVANAFAFEAIVVIAILVVGYSAQSLYAAALAS